MIPALFLILSAVAYRIVTGLSAIRIRSVCSNFAPLAAIALCAAAYFPPKYKFTVPLIALLISDVVLNAHYRLLAVHSGGACRITSASRSSVASACFCKIDRR